MQQDIQPSAALSGSGGLQRETTVVITDKNYYNDHSHITFSALKVFSRCETLYRDIFVNKTYEEPDKDYFVYGRLVDALLTETPEYVKQNFVMVSSKVKLEDALKHENEKQELLNQIKELQAKDKDKIDKWSQEMKEINNKETGTAAQKRAKSNKLIKLQGQIDELKENPSPIVLKGIESREKKIHELDQKLKAIKETGNMMQVTKAVWKNAEETALAIKTHPYFSNMEFNQFTSQQILTVARDDGIDIKGKLDHLKLSPEVEKIYKMFISKMISREEMQNTIDRLPYESKWAIITDIKSCYNMEKLEPYNKHYRGQLGFYQNLVNGMLRIPMEKITCQIFVGDKIASEFKRAEIFKYNQESLDELKGDVEAWIRIWAAASISGKYVSAKKKYGMKQQCFTCSECRMAPFAQEPGIPVLITSPRFPDRTEEAMTDISELLVEY